MGQGDLESLGLLKVDVLALGMLSMIWRALGLLAQWRMQDIPHEDAATDRLIQAADTVEFASRPGRPPASSPKPPRARSS